MIDYIDPTALASSIGTWSARDTGNTAYAGATFAINKPAPGSSYFPLYRSAYEDLNSLSFAFETFSYRLINSIRIKINLCKYNYGVAGAAVSTEGSTKGANLTLFCNSVVVWTKSYANLTIAVTNIDEVIPLSGLTSGWGNFALQVTPVGTIGGNASNLRAVAVLWASVEVDYSSSDALPIINCLLLKRPVGEAVNALVLESVALYSYNDKIISSATETGINCLTLVGYNSPPFVDRYVYIKLGGKFIPISSSLAIQFFIPTTAVTVGSWFYFYILGTAYVYIIPTGYSYTAALAGICGAIKQLGVKASTTSDGIIVQGAAAIFLRLPTTQYTDRRILPTMYYKDVTFTPI